MGFRKDTQIKFRLVFSFIGVRNDNKRSRFHFESLNFGPESSVLGLSCFLIVGQKVDIQWQSSAIINAIESKALIIVDGASGAFAQKTNDNRSH